MVYNKLNTEPNQNYGATKSTFVKARSLRKRMTKSEKLLWNKLRKRQLNGMHFRKQHPVDCYIVDFYCHQAQLVIEVDGKIHQFQKEYDRNRQKVLESLGLTVIRFKNEEVETDMNGVVNRILECL